MFGHSALFADYVDIILACGGRLKKVVVNIADDARPNRKSFADRLAEVNRHAAKEGRPSIEVEKLEHFRPAAGERYVIGFRGVQLTPLRDDLVRRFGLRFETLMHPSAVVSPTAGIGEGVIVNAGAVIASFAAIGEFALINRGAAVGHDCRIAAFANIGPGARLASNVTVERGAAVGIGATVIENLTIGEGAYVAAGAVAIRDVPAQMVVAGVPAEAIKSRDQIRRS
jgi:sugar O-acyltransferase (sialic acid O-acetyltransferase NeuD family)